MNSDYNLDYLLKQSLTPSVGPAFNNELASESSSNNTKSVANSESFTSKFNLFLLNGKYDLAFSHAIYAVEQLPKEKLSTLAFENWTRSLIEEVFQATKGLEKVIDEDKINPFMYYLNKFLSVINKDYGWLSTILPPSLMEFLFSILVKSKDLNTAQKFLPFIQDKYIFNYPGIIEHCFNNKDKKALHFILSNLEGASEKSVEFLLDIYANLGALEAVSFASKFNVDPFYFSNVKNQNLMTAALLEKDLYIVQHYLRQDNLNSLMIENSTKSGTDNTLHFLNEDNALFFADLLFSFELPKSIINHLNKFSFSPEFIKKASGTNYYKKLFAQLNFESKEATNHKLEIYYELVDQSFAHLKQIKPKDVNSKIMDSINKINVVIEDFLLSYTKPVSDIGKYNELTYVLAQQQKLPYCINSSLIDKVSKNRPELLHEKINGVSVSTLLQGLNSGKAQYEKSLEQNSLNIVSIKDKIKLPKYVLSLMNVGQKKKPSATPIDAIEEKDFSGQVSKKVLELKNYLEQKVNASDEFFTKAQSLVLELSSVNDLIINTKYSYSQEESYMLRQNVPGYIQNLIDHYVTIKNIGVDRLSEKMNIQYELIKEQLELIRHDITESLAILADKNMSGDNLFLSSKNQKFMKLNSRN